MDTHQSSRNFGFFSLSTFIHAGIFIFFTVFAADIFEQPKQKEIIQFEIASTPLGQQLETPRPAPAITAVRASAPSPLNHLNASDVVVPAPALETGELDQAPDVSVAELDESVISDDLDKIDQETAQENAADIAQAKSQADAQAQALINEQNSKLAVIEKQHQEEEKQNAMAIAQRKAKEKAHREAALATKIAADQAAQQQLADQAEAERSARQQAAAQAAAELAAQKAAEAAAHQAEEAAAQRASHQAAAKAAAIAAAEHKTYGAIDGVRDLKDLRQKPGNRRPDYDLEDRYNKREGEVSFLAYISREGSVTQVKALKLTGHRTLDAKTLKAIRDWKFYPGQEGWVEIPFNWGLKGGAQEMPSGLRRKVSQNQ